MRLAKHAQFPHITMDNDATDTFVEIRYRGFKVKGEFTNKNEAIRWMNAQEPKALQAKINRLDERADTKAAKTQNPAPKPQPKPEPKKPENRPSIPEQVRALSDAELREMRAESRNYDDSPSSNAYRKAIKAEWLRRFGSELPNFEEVYAAFSRFHSAQQRIRAGMPFGEMMAAFAKLRDEFKADLEKLGLAKRIDWTDKAAERREKALQELAEAEDDDPEENIYLRVRGETQKPAHRVVKAATKAR